ncbi:MAG: DsbA family protein [Proteobacteria bacterium]|nr:DsbA family protein [Pseudomonadota bacterium]
MADRRKLPRQRVGWLLLPLLLVGAAGIWFATDPGFRAARDAPDAASSRPQDEFERRVRAYLLDNPEVIVEAMQRLQARQRAAELDETQMLLEAHAEEVFRDPASPVGGNPEGDVTLVEFFDYNCPYCRRVAPVMAEVEAADPRLRVVYKEFPILGPNSLFAAKAALAADGQGKYVAFHRALMQTQGAAAEPTVLKLAAEIGLDVARLRNDMERPEIQASIERNLALAQALRINGTPGFVIGDGIIRGAADLTTLQAQIREARKRK